jgi:hypothetical protein
MKGLIIAGEYGSILCRQKADAALELGELLVADAPGGRMLLQVTDLLYGSQLAQPALEMVSGLKLEEENDLGLMDGGLRNYILAKLKSLAFVSGEGAAALPKRLPRFFSHVREVKADDLGFLAKPAHALPLGLLRSGSRVLDVPVQVDGLLALSHHLLIAGTTGRGKSVLMSNLLWDLLDAPWCGLLVLDPHDEYYGRGKDGLKDHPHGRERLAYYTPRDPPPGSHQLRIALSQLLPRHFDGVMDWSDPQREALLAYHRAYGEEWVAAVLTDRPVPNFHENTIAVVKRRLGQLLDIASQDGRISCRGIFHDTLGQSTARDIVRAMEDGMLVVVDTSTFSGPAEILVGSIIASELLDRRRQLGFDELSKRPVTSIVLEEAPRVLGQDVLERGPNVFASIAREGRKFRVGLVAITQLPSLIPKDILANLNTKIILGLENKAERQAIIESAPQDLSDDDRAIAALDKGEAIATSTFLRFAMPLRVPSFSARVRDALASRQQVRPSFAGVRN